MLLTPITLLSHFRMFLNWWYAYQYLPMLGWKEIYIYIEKDINIYQAFYDCVLSHSYFIFSSFMNQLLN